MNIVHLVTFRPLWIDYYVIFLVTKNGLTSKQTHTSVLAILSLLVSYLDSNRKALAESYQLTTDFFTEHNIDYIPTEAGPFLMIDLRSSFKRSHGQELTREDEQTLWHNMMQHGVYIAPGSVFHLETPGLYRVTFALPWEILEKGLNMIVDSLDF